jgi:hypothetical protein
MVLTTLAVMAGAGWLARRRRRVDTDSSAETAVMNAAMDDQSVGFATARRLVMRRRHSVAKFVLPVFPSTNIAILTDLVAAFNLGVWTQVKNSQTEALALMSQLKTVQVSVNAGTAGVYGAISTALDLRLGPLEACRMCMSVICGGPLKFAELKLSRHARAGVMCR